jgi:hypothetical protein
MPELFCTPHFAETMYCHFDEQIQQHNTDPQRRLYLEEQQEAYVYMHSLVIPIENIIADLIN